MGQEALFQIINGVVGGACTYYPGYVKSTGEFVTPHLTVPIYVNRDDFGRDNAAADPNAKRRPSSFFELTIWGEKPCAVAAHWFTSGKRLTLRGRMDSKKLAVKDNQNNMVLQISTGLEVDPDTDQKFQRGMQIPIYRWRNSLIIERFHFGEDSADANRRKPVGWNVEGTQGYLDFQQYIRNMQASQAAGYQGGDTFGLAKVGRVNGQLARKDAAGNIIPMAATVAPGFAAPGAVIPGAVLPQPGVVLPQPGAVLPQPGVIVNTAMAAAGALNPNATVHPPNMGTPIVTSPPAPVAQQFVNAAGQPCDAAGNLIVTPGVVVDPNAPGPAFNPNMYAGM